MQRILAAVLAVMLSATAHADEAAAARLNVVLTGLASMQADFSQTTRDSRGQLLQGQGGRMSVKRPGLFRWEVATPSVQVVTTNGSVLWIYDPDLKQVTKQKLDSQVGNTPALLLSGDPRKLADAFDITEEKAGRNEQVFLLRPRANDALFDHLRVRFAKGQLQQMQLADSLGQNTDIRFSKIKVNPALASSLFDFTPPKGVDVIDEI
ncbi:MAG: outer membrane lipoprotein chaperone LolA [Moraxellaceae bacterium]|nr:outer membrane lipoprotein chaperone LolA [Moraxellaceae bacterium]